MDESQFYEECGEETGAYFRVLMAAWSKDGGVFKWGRWRCQPAR